MEDMFYIACLNEEDDWWQLRLKENHMVISCGVGKEHILDCLRTIVKRYRTPIKFKMNFGSMNYNYVTKSERETGKKLYVEQGKYLLDEVNKVINETLDKYSTNNRYSSTLKLKAKNTTTNNTTIKEENAPTKKDTISTRRFIRKRIRD